MTTLANRSLRMILRRWLQGLLGDAAAVEQVLLGAVPPKGSDIVPGQCAANLFVGAFQAHSAAATPPPRQPLSRGSFAELAVVQLLAAIVTRPEANRNVNPSGSFTTDEKYLATSQVRNHNSAPGPSYDGSTYESTATSAASPHHHLLSRQHTHGSHSSLSAIFNASTASSSAFQARDTRAGKHPPLGPRWRKASRCSTKVTTATSHNMAARQRRSRPCARVPSRVLRLNDSNTDASTTTPRSPPTPTSPHVGAFTPPPPAPLQPARNVMDTAASDFELPPASGPSIAFLAAQDATSVRPFHTHLGAGYADDDGERDSVEDSAVPVVKQTSVVHGASFDTSDSDAGSDSSLVSANEDEASDAALPRHVSPHPSSYIADDELGEINQYVLLERLGRGSQGEVFLAMDTDAGELRALKIVRRPMAGERVTAAKRKVLEDLAREIAAMKLLRHPNVVALHEVIDDPCAGKMFLALQYVENGPIAQMRPDGTATCTYDPPRLIRLAQQMCAGLSYLHRNGVIHRDVKPENILVGMNDHVFLADFGVSEVFQPSGGGNGTDDERRNRVHGTRGTPAFLAPELLEVKLDPRSTVTSTEDCAAGGGSPPEFAGEPVDVWALGMTLYVLLYGKLPWEFTDARDLFEAIQRRPIELRPQVAMAAASLSQSPAFAPLVLPDPRSDVTSPTALRPCLPAAAPRIALEVRPPSPSPLAAVPDARPIRELCSFSEPPQQYTDAGSSSPHRRSSAAMTAEESLFGASRGEMGGLARRVTPLSPTHANASVRTSGNSSLTAPSSAVAASADEGWRRLLAEMLQRDPKRRATLVDVRRHLHVLEHRVEQARAMGSQPAQLSPAATKRRL